MSSAVVPSEQAHITPLNNGQAPCCACPSPRPKRAKGAWLCMSCGAIREAEPVPFADVEFARAASPCCDDAGWRVVGSDAKFVCLSCGEAQSDDNDSAEPVRSDLMYHELAREHPEVAGMVALARLLDPAAEQPPGTVAVMCRHGRFCRWSPRPIAGDLPDCINGDTCEPTECAECYCDLEHDGTQWVARDTDMPARCNETGGRHVPVGATVPV